MNVYRWINAAAWRWRTVHFLTAAALEQLALGYGVVAYASHEITQAVAAGEWQEKNSLDLAAAVLGAVVGNIPRVLRVLA